MNTLLPFEQHAEDFKAILDNAKVGPKSKTLALQELPKYVSRFPDHMDATLDILIDLFEESDTNHLKAIDGWRAIASSASGPVITKLVGVLAQLLQSEVEAEVKACQSGSGRRSAKRRCSHHDSYICTGCCPLTAPTSLDYPRCCWQALALEELSPFKSSPPPNPPPPLPPA